MLDIVSDPSAGTPEDKMRLFVIYYLLSPDMTEGELTQYTAALESVGADVRPLEYLKKWKWVIVCVLTVLHCTLAELSAHVHNNETQTCVCKLSMDCTELAQCLPFLWFVSLFTSPHLKYTELLQNRSWPLSLHIGTIAHCPNFVHNYLFLHLKWVKRIV